MVRFSQADAALKNADGVPLSLPQMAGTGENTHTVHVNVYAERVVHAAPGQYAKRLTDLVSHVGYHQKDYVVHFFEYEASRPAATLGLHNPVTKQDAINAIHKYCEIAEGVHGHRRA